jgi:hypothetical protein
MRLTRGVIVAVAGMTWNEYEVPFSQGMIDAQNSAIDDFWAAIQSDTKPAWDGAESTFQAVRMQYEDIDGSECDLGELGLQLLNAQLTADKAYATLMQYKSMVLDNMQNAKFGVVIDNEVTRRIASRQLRAGSPTLIVNKKG